MTGVNVNTLLSRKRYAVILLRKRLKRAHDALRFIGGEIVKLLWNWLMPAIFSVRPLTFWEALGMLALCRILFGGIAGRGLAGSNVRHRTGEHRERLRQRIRARSGLNGSDPS